MFKRDVVAMSYQRQLSSLGRSLVIGLDNVLLVIMLVTAVTSITYEGEGFGRWIVRITNGNKNCTGTLVTPCHVLSTTWCIGKDNGIRMYLGEGEPNRDNVQIAIEKTPRTYKIIRTTGATITQLASCVNITQYVAPVKIASTGVKDDTKTTVHALRDSSNDKLEYPLEIHQVTVTTNCPPVDQRLVLCVHNYTVKRVDFGGAMVAAAEDGQPCMVGFTRGTEDITDKETGKTKPFSMYTNVALDEVANEKLFRFVKDNPCTKCNSPSVRICKPLDDSQSSDKREDLSDQLDNTNKSSSKSGEKRDFPFTNHWLARVKNGNRLCTGIIVTKCHIVVPSKCVQNQLRSKQNSRITVYAGHNATGKVQVVKASAENQQLVKVAVDSIGVTIFKLDKCLDTSTDDVGPIGIGEYTVADGSSVTWSGLRGQKKIINTPMTVKTERCKTILKKSSIPYHICATGSLPDSAYEGGSLVVKGSGKTPCLVGIYSKQSLATFEQSLSKLSGRFTLFTDASFPDFLSILGFFVMVKPCTECGHNPKIQTCSGYNAKYISHNCPPFGIEGGSYTVTCKNENKCTAKITCDRCYVLQGEASRTCVKDQWMEDLSTSCIVDPQVECGNDSDCVGGHSTCWKCKCVCRSDSDCIEHNMGNICDTSVEEGTCRWGCRETLQPPRHGFIIYAPKELINGSSYTFGCGAGYELGGSEVRVCADGIWEGDETFCVLANDECRGITCMHDSVCIDGPGYFTCACEYGYDGQFCELDIDECLSSPCINGGECGNFVGDFRCDCPTGWVGGRCEGEDLCYHTDPCPEGSKCENVINKFAKPLCDTNDEICESAPTVDTRVVTTNVTGPECDYNLLEFCKERNVKSNATLTYSCNCAYGFTGLNCETPIPTTTTTTPRPTPITRQNPDTKKICPRGFLEEGHMKTCQLTGSACDVENKKCCGCNLAFNEGIRWKKWVVRPAGMVPQWPSTVTRRGRCLCEACLEEHCIPAHILEQWKQEKQEWDAINK